MVVRHGWRLRGADGRGRALSVLLAGALLAGALAGCASGTGGGGSEPSTTSIPRVTSTTTAPSTTGPSTPTPSSAPGPSFALGGYMPLFPFATLQDVQTWEESFSSGGQQPWHLDAGQTAVAFAAWLGYAEVNTVVSTTTNATGAHVSIGFSPDATSGPPVVSAVVHEVRWGSGSNVAWEVVGTDDTTLTLSAPPYGSTVASPVRVGGVISGVDESIKVEVHDLASSSPIGVYCCLPAGGTGTPWSALVSFAAAPGAVMTIAAQTGGHVAAVERFAVTGVRSGL